MNRHYWHAIRALLRTAHIERKASALFEGALALGLGRHCRKKTPRAPYVEGPAGDLALAEDQEPGLQAVQEEIVGRSQRQWKED